jgi:hypothetical protein
MNILKTATRLFQKLQKWFKRKGYNNLVPESQALVHLAVHLVQAVKTITVDTVLDDVVADLLCKLLPSQASTIRKFKLQLEQNIPQWLLQLQIADAVLDAWKNRTSQDVDTTAAEEENKLLLAVIKTLNVSDQRQEAYSELATRCLYYLGGGANGKLDWQDCRDLVEEYYTNYVKGEIT